MIETLLYIYELQTPSLFLFRYMLSSTFPPNSLPSPPSCLSPHPTWEFLGRGVGRGGIGRWRRERKRRNNGRVLREIERSIRMSERSDSSPCERWVAWSTARMNATNNCLYLPTLLCYHFVLHSLAGWREAEPVRPMCKSATYTACPVNAPLTFCVPSHHFPGTGHVDDWSLHDEVAPPLSDFSWDQNSEQMVPTGSISPSK